MKNHIILAYLTFYLYLELKESSQNQMTLTIMSKHEQIYIIFRSFRDTHSMISANPRYSHIRSVPKERPNHNKNMRRPLNFMISGKSASSKLILNYSSTFT